MSEEAEPIPADVIWARGVRFHLQAVYACAGAVAVLCILGVAAVLMAGPLAQDPPITAGILALCIGGVAAVAGAFLAGLGQIRVLREAGGSAPDPTYAVSQILGRTRRAFTHLPRVSLAGCVALLAAYTLWLPAGIWGAIVGTFVVVQVALALTLVRRSVLSGARLLRRE